jgi:hypothetical protein
MFVAKHHESTDGVSPRHVENEDPVIHCIAGNYKTEKREKREKRNELDRERDGLV